eukprot:m.127108 g.127108  ORF g.127108 m.127108 type:complete len:183 (-) comp17408_c0_seq3:221-769(-)
MAREMLSTPALCDVSDDEDPAPFAETETAAFSAANTHAVVHTQENSRKRSAQCCHCFLKNSVHIIVVEREEHCPVLMGADLPAHLHFCAEQRESRASNHTDAAFQGVCKDTEFMKHFLREHWHCTYSLHLLQFLVHRLDHFIHQTGNSLHSIKNTPVNYWSGLEILAQNSLFSRCSHIDLTT